jgi:hypothetical protein
VYSSFPNAAVNMGDEYDVSAACTICGLPIINPEVRRDVFMIPFEQNFLLEHFCHPCVKKLERHV